MEAALLSASLIEVEEQRDAAIVLLRWFVDQIRNIRPAHPNVAKAIQLLDDIDNPA